MAKDRNGEGRNNEQGKSTTISSELRPRRSSSSWARSKKASSKLRRRKADMVYILAHNLRFCGDQAFKKAVSLIMSFWDDVDGWTRRTSIEMIQYLFLQGRKVGEYFEVKQGKASGLVAEITSRLQDETYPEREMLSNLMQGKL